MSTFGPGDKVTFKREPDENPHEPAFPWNIWQHAAVMAIRGGSKISPNVITPSDAPPAVMAGQVAALSGQTGTVERLLMDGVESDAYDIGPTYWVRIGPLVFGAFEDELTRWLHT